MTSERLSVAQGEALALPDPNLHPPTVAESGDPFSALRVVHLLARLPRGERLPIGDVTARLNAEFLDWVFSPRVVADTIAQVQANWIADYRGVEGIRLEDDPSGAWLEIEDSARSGPWLVEQAQRLAAECRTQLREFARGEGRATEG
jgi:hypothetical protein